MILFYFIFSFICINWRLITLQYCSDDLREQHQNMYIIKCETDHQSRLDA